MNIQVTFKRKHFTDSLSTYVTQTIKGYIENHKERLYKDDSIIIPMEEIDSETFRVVEVIHNFPENTILYIIE